MRAQDILPDGIDGVELGGTAIRKGTVGAFLTNAAAFRDPSVTGEARAAVLRDIEEALPALRALGLFEVLEIRDPELRAFVTGFRGGFSGRPPMTVRPDLDALYAPPAGMIQRAVLDRLIDCHEAYLKLATFFCLATGSGNGLDASPRGGPPGFVQVLDPRTLAFADWPGNNRIESMRNLERDDRVGMLFLFPGLEVFLRINGRGRVSTEPGLLERLAEGKRLPKAAIVVSVGEVLFHCGKAVNRAGLWAETARLDRRALPSVGRIMASIAELDDAQARQLDEHYDHSVRHDLY